jgi:hypothetical protein
VKDIWDSFKDNSKDDGKTEENSNGLMPLLNILEEYIHPIRFAIQFIISHNKNIWQIQKLLKTSL